MRLAAIISALLCVAGANGLAQEPEPLIHYSFDQAGDGIADLSGNDLHASGGGPRVDGPLGSAMSFDGTPGTVVSVELPEGMRFGTGSWSFMAWLHPTQLSIDDPQDQRRIFAYGTYPDAYLVIDVGGSGRVSYYFCYRGPDDEIVSTGGGGPLHIREDEWSHVAVVCDRAQREVSVYVNGYRGSPNELPADFSGDFSISGELTIGSGWHNYWGLMDEVRVYAGALPAAAVREAFRSHMEDFGVAESELTRAAERRERAERAMDQAMGAWERGDFGEVREQCAAIYDDGDLAPQLRSYLHLVAAQSYTEEGDGDAARAEYERIAATEAYPDVHRMEARELAREEPLDTRSPVEPITDFAAELHVAVDGDDAADGSPDAPLATLTAARDRVRALKAEGVDGSILVAIHSGEYAVTETFALTAEDGGSADAPVVYRGVGGEAILYGGERIDAFEDVTDPAVLSRMPEDARGSVMQCDLAALGIEDYGELAVRGFGQPPAPPTLELFVDGVPMTIARWPNEGFVRIGELVAPGSRADGIPSSFEYLDERHERWLEAEDLWLFGYFKYLWADSTIPVAEIDPETKTLTTEIAYQYGDGGMSDQQGIQYYAFNLLEEIDRPGEYYLDRDAGVLYLYPPGDLAEAEVEIGLFDQPMITMDGVSHVRIEGLTLDLGRYRGMVLQDCADCIVAGCTVSRMADNGIMVHGGEGVTLHSCHVHTIGRRATEVIGGDRETLTPGNHLVENCRIHDFGRIDRTYTPAIQLEGVGNRVAHNLMYDGPSSAMRIEGNDHVVEYNEFHRVVLESDDQGAIDVFRNPTYRGLVFRHNHFHDLGNTDPDSGVHGQAAIRLDDAISGQLIYGNLFERCANGNFGAVQMNSGRDNIIDGNVFIDCRQGISGGYFPGNSVWRGLREGSVPGDFYMGELYLERYPGIGRMLEEPGINFVWRNVFAGCDRLATHPGGLEQLGNREYDTEHFDPTDTPPGMRPIPVDLIGLYAGAFRKHAEP
ncbi:MAG: hypothetical protein GF320_07635 [Armatimonadia bacterium]|nr:hypothetical protein [Armatimonadia bacterium]